MGIYVFKLADMKFGSEGFALFNLARRIYSFFVVFGSLGLSVGLVRFLALYMEDNQKRFRIFSASLFILITFNSLVLLIIFVLNSPISYIFFHSYTESLLLLSIALATLANSYSVAIYSYYRGTMKMFRANLIQVLNSALIPLLSILFSNSPAQAFFFQALFVCVVCLIVSFFIIKNERWNLFKKWYDFAGWIKHSASEFKLLLRYCIPRVPAEFAYSAYFTLPPVALIHFGASQVDGGMFAFGISLMSMLGASLSSFGYVMLPRATRMLKAGKFAQFKRIAILMSILSSVIGTFVFLIFYFFGSNIVEIFSKELSEGASRYVVIAQFAGIFHLQFVAIRSFIDAAHFISYNSINTIKSFLFMLLFISINFLFPATNFFVLMSLPFVFLSLSTLSFITLFKNKIYLNQSYS